MTGRARHSYDAGKNVKLSSESGDSCSKKGKRGSGGACGEVWWDSRVWSQAVCCVGASDSNLALVSMKIFSN
jgi:hypothetical protein